MTDCGPQDAHNSRDRILAVATELFAQKGYSGTGVDQVAARAEIAKTAIYYHFGSKEGLLTAVLEHTATAWIDGIRAAARDADGPLQRLDRALHGIRTMLEESPWILKLLQLLALEVADEKPEIRATLQRLAQHARTAITDGMREALGIELRDAATIASILLACVDGLALGRLIDPELITLDAAFEELRRVTMFMVASRVDPNALAAIAAITPQLTT